MIKNYIKTESKNLPKSAINNIRTELNATNWEITLGENNISEKYKNLINRIMECLNKYAPKQEKRIKSIK